MSFRRRLGLIAAIGFGALSLAIPTGAVYGQVDPSPDPTNGPDVPESTIAALPTSTTEPTAPPTTTTIAPCEKTADVAVVFIGKPVLRDDTKVTFEVDRVITGDLKSPTAVVNFPRDYRFFYEETPYRVTASYDAESKVYVSKVRVPRYAAAHCVAKDKIYTTYDNGLPIDTGIFDGMRGQWKSLPWYFIQPMAGAVGVLAVLVLLKKAIMWMLRQGFDELHDREVRQARRRAGTIGRD